jgi:hypothetical protein
VDNPIDAVIAIDLDIATLEKNRNAAYVRQHPYEQYSVAVITVYFRISVCDVRQENPASRLRTAVPVRAFPTIRLTPPSVSLGASLSSRFFAKNRLIPIFRTAAPYHAKYVARPPAPPRNFLPFDPSNLCGAT